MALSNPAALPAAPPRRRFDGWAVLCIGVYVLLGLALIARVPLEQTPDEAAHGLYIQHVATLHSLPIFEGAVPGQNPGYEFHQPPLYYVLAAPLWAALPAGAQQYSARLVSLLCGALTVWLVLAAARAMFKAGADDERGERLARRAGMLAALWPLHIAVGSSSNNDALAGLCCAALFWRLALLSRRAPTVRDGLWIGALAGLGLLSKSTTLTVSVACVLALWHLARRTSAQASAQDQGGEPVQVLVEPGRILGASVLCALGVCGWNLVRNTRLYGDALAYGVFKAASNAATLGMAEFAQPPFNISSFVYVRNVLAVLLATNWGLYGGPNAAWMTMRLFTPRPQWPGGILGLAALILLASSTWVLLRGLALGARVAGRLRSGSGSAGDVIWMWWGVALGLVALAYAQFALTSFSGAQGRYLHVALLPACLLASRTWDDLPRAWRGPLGLLVGLVLLGLTLGNVLLWHTLSDLAP